MRGDRTRPVGSIERQFNLSAPGNGAHVLVHFEAVDYITTVIVNGKTVGEHQGGYDPFTVDVTEALTTPGTQDLIVKVIDTTGQGNLSRSNRCCAPF